MKSILSYLGKLWSSAEFKRRFVFTLFILAVFRLLAHVPVSGVDIEQVKNYILQESYLQLLNILSGGTLTNASLVALGMSPYITASIIMQLSALLFPRLKELQKDGEAGRQQVNQYTRLLSVPLAVVQSVSVIALLRSYGLVSTADPLALASVIASLVAGAMIVLWLGELVSEYGIGNGISMLLLGGIVSQIPSGVKQVQFMISFQQYTVVAVFLAVFLAVIGLIVFMNEAIRKVSIQYAKRMRGSQVYGSQGSHLPIKVNVAGVMPIIFAVSVMLLPSFIARLLQMSDNPALLEWGAWLTLSFTETSPIYMLTYFIIVFSFTYFSAILFFNTDDISEELKKSGAFIPGIRPGAATKQLLDFIVTRITFFGALFLGFIALLPSFAQYFSGLSSLAVGGTSVLIVVSVILETSKQIESLLVEQDYDRFM